MFSSGGNASTVDENSESGQVIYTASAIDASDVKFTLENNVDNKFSINKITGEIVLQESSDYETIPSYTFIVMARDTAGNTSKQKVKLKIKDIIEANKNGNVSRINFPDIILNYTKIPGGIYKDFYLRGNLTIPSRVTSIGISAFNAYNLKSLDTGNSVTHIHKNAFSDNQKLQKLKLGKSVKYIGESAFEKSSIKSLKIPDSVTHIGPEAFLDGSIKSIYIPDCVKDIGANAFNGNPLVKASLPSHFEYNKQIAFAFNPRNKITFRDKG